MKHIENMNKIILLTGSLVGYAYGMEFFIAWYSGNEYEGFAFINRAFGPYWWAYWSMISCNVIIPQIFWFRKIRTNITITFIISIFVNIGMWFERFVIAVTSLHRRLLAIQLGLLRSYRSRHLYVYRFVRPVLHPIPAFYSLPTGNRHG